MKAADYEHMLDESQVLDRLKELSKEETIYLQQEGEPSDRAKTGVEFIENLVALVKDWPVNSPDLSVVENVWVILKLPLAQRAPTLTLIPELKRMFLKEWDVPDQHMIDNLVKWTPKRFELCLEHEGQYIGHLLNLMQLAAHRSKFVPIPDRFVIPRMIRITQVSHQVKIFGYVTRLGHVEG
jgi:hypothetical protein